MGITLSFDTHARWQPVTQSPRSGPSYGKIEDCEQSIYSHARNSHFFLIFSCMSSKFMCLRFSTLCCSSSWRTEIIFWLKKQLKPHFFKFNKPTHSLNEKGSTGIFGKISRGESVKQDTEILGKSYFGASNSQISLCVELAKTEQMAKKDYWQQ